uniref:ATP synthase complex subunit 8 n=1 Tax=Tenebrionoidea sp. 22 KM-2017 TaxID=2219478 RepID=A0A346RKK6_9CUCU|nr:ATP synthase F0 subunit 8 [Tenebrionoidea sp. 22 KM-2017]
MPQMSPLNWLTLMFFFIMIFIMLKSLNYFSFLYQYKPSSKSLNKKFLLNNWKW